MQPVAKSVPARTSAPMVLSSALWRPTSSRTQVMPRPGWIQAAACTLPYGAGSVQVVVTWRGHVVWDSGACKSSAAKPVRFTLGVPQELTMIWNPKAAQPAGCAGSLPAGAAGTLDAVAMSDGQSSPVRSFTLSR